MEPSSTKTDLKILIIEANPLLSDVLEQKVKHLGFNLCCTATPSMPINQLATLSPELAIMGPSLETETCLKCIHKLRVIDPAMPILTSCDDACLPNGSAATPFDSIHYLSPDLDVDEILGTLHSVLEHRTESKSWPDSPVVLIGQNANIKHIRKRIQMVSNKDITVLITGETGTGKELIARSIHYHSHRSKGGLVKISCGALPDELLESEVFGFQRGAFTGAHKDKPGRLEMANGGTLFIDEIGDLSLSLQVKFLQVFEHKTFSRLGGTRDAIIDTRVVAATNSDLRKKVEEGTFRKDLFYRLNVVHIKMPPLRARRDDIPLLAHYFINKYCFELKKGHLDIPDEITELFLAYQWPGNVRELENVIRRAIVLQNWSFAFGDLNLESPNHEIGDGSSSQAGSYDFDWHDEMTKSLGESGFSLRGLRKAHVSRAERDAIMKVLDETQWNRRKAARLLRVSYKTLLNRITEYDLKPTDRRKA